MAKKLLHAFYGAALAALLTTLTACGGGGGGGSTAPLPTTQPPTDTSPPTVTSFRAVNEATGLNIDANGAKNLPSKGTKFVVTYTDQTATGLATPASTISCAGFPTTRVIENVSWVLSCASPVVTITPESGNLPTNLVSVTLSGVRDPAGNASSAYKVDFTVEGGSSGPVGLVLSESSLSKVKIVEGGTVSEFFARCVTPTGCNIVDWVFSLKFSIERGTMSIGIGFVMGANTPWQSSSFLSSWNTDNSFVFQLNPDNGMTVVAGKIPYGDTYRFALGTNAYPFNAEVQLTTLTAVDNNKQPIKVGGDANCKSDQLIAPVACPDKTGSGTTSASYNAVITAP